MQAHNRAILSTVIGNRGHARQHGHGLTHADQDEYDRE
jgi:hypothetical protein